MANDGIEQVGGAAARTREEAASPVEAPGGVGAARTGSRPGPHRVVIVGGGAGGLELATRLGNRYRRRRDEVEVILVEKARTHFWKPHLHEIAAGSMDLDRHETDYLAQAHWHHFRYIAGPMIGVDRKARVVKLGPVVDLEGERISDEREVAYDTLVIGIGSLTHHFGIPGVAEHAIALETPQEANRFHERLVNACFRAQAQQTPLRPGQLRVVIIGAGATGVELAAELHKTTRTLVSYGLDRIDPDKDLRITLIEAGPRILPALPERVSATAASLLVGLNVELRTAARVAEVKDGEVLLATGETIPAELVVWAAGIKAPAVLADLDGLEANRINQLVVKPTLETTRDPNVFAIGDCAACAWIGGPEGAIVPARAQAAHQQASHLVGQLARRLAGQPLTDWHYRDFGSLVSLGRYSAVGNLMGSLTGRKFWVDGFVARMMYRLLYKQHQIALHGYWKVALDTLAGLITRRTEPQIKLH